MSKDVKICSDEINFKLRVNGIIIKDNHILTVQMNNNGFYCLPGGHVELGEDTKTAVVREIKEETNIETKVVKLLSIAENFFKRKNGKEFHELSFYYLLEPIKDFEAKDYSIIEHDKDQDLLLDFKWFNIDNLNQIEFKPTFLSSKLSKGDFLFNHVIIK